MGKQLIVVIVCLVVIPVQGGKKIIECHHTIHFWIFQSQFHYSHIGYFLLVFESAQREGHCFNHLSIKLIPLKLKIA